MAKVKVKDSETGKEKEVETVGSGWSNVGTGAAIGAGALGTIGGVAGTAAVPVIGTIPAAIASGAIGAGVGALGGAVAGGFDGYKVNNLFRQGTSDQLNTLIDFVAREGYYPSDSQIKKLLGNVSDRAMNNLKGDLTTFLAKNNVSYMTQEEYLASNPQDRAFNQYFDQIYSTDVGTLGGDIYQNLANIERNNALANMELAEAQAQQLSMQQAEATKALADQVRAERMAKLRAGMNEAQIANQDMQAMMNNMQARNQQVAATNAAKLQAAQQYNLAQNTAYQQWLQNANTMGQTGAAYAASDAGDAMAQARAYAAATGVPVSQAYKVVTGNTK